MSGWAASLPACRPRCDLFSEGIAHLTCPFRRPDGDADGRAATVDEASVGKFVVQREPDGLRRWLVCSQVDIVKGLRTTLEIQPRRTGHARVAPGSPGAAA